MFWTFFWLPKFRDYLDLTSNPQFSVSVKTFSRGGGNKKTSIAEILSTKTPSSSLSFMIFALITAMFVNKSKNHEGFTPCSSFGDDSGSIEIIEQDYSYLANPNPHTTHLIAEQYFCSGHQRALVKNG